MVCIGIYAKVSELMENINFVKLSYNLDQIPSAKFQKSTKNELTELNVKLTSSFFIFHLTFNTQISKYVPKNYSTIIFSNI